MKKEFIKSSILHSLPILLMLIHGLGTSEAKNKGKDTKFVAPDKIEVTLPDDIKGPKKKKPKLSKRYLEKCKDSWYGGIGIKRIEATGEVTEAPEYYPAYIAGIRVGDMLLSEKEILGEPGTEVDVRVERDSDKYTFTVMRDRICYDK